MLLRLPTFFAMTVASLLLRHLLPAGVCLLWHSRNSRAREKPIRGPFQLLANCSDDIHCGPQADGQQLTLKQLGKQVRQHWQSAAAEFGPPPDVASLKSILRLKMERIEGVTADGKRVALAA